MAGLPHRLAGFLRQALVSPKCRHKRDEGGSAIERRAAAGPWARLNLMLVWVFLLACAGGTGAGAETPGWTAKSLVKGKGNRVEVRNKDLMVDFGEPVAWTICNIRYQDCEIVGEHGYQGTVVNVRLKEAGAKKAGWIGTGHGLEQIKSFAALVNQSNQVLAAGAEYRGGTVAIRKESNIGPFDLVSETLFSATGDHFVERHQYKVLEDLGERFNHLYAFMHCHNNKLTHWLALLGEGKEEQGEAVKDDNANSLKKDIKAIVFYGPEIQKGVVYVYPEVYEGCSKPSKNFIWDRPKDNKLYFCPEIKRRGYKAGDSFEYAVAVIPFSAGSEDWKTKGRELAGKTYF
ncbi:MAG: hypothetical protein PHV34_20850 [Verrucomicrobiae bacterium]|nr:hypothetical protein [Verrucomicrobiae bacterium]